MPADNLIAANYCACFIDLLGQRDAMKGEGLLPDLQSVDGEKALVEKIRSSVGAIALLQENAEYFNRDFPEISIRDSLDDDEKEIYDNLRSNPVRHQRWSDGLVIYSSMVAKAPMEAIFDILWTAGSLALLGLAQRRPIRGGIDISWGVELHENELYGPIVANTYEIESRIAQYPRVVVSKRLVDYIRLAIAETATDPYTQVNRTLALRCADWLTEDIDGFMVVDYVSTDFSTLLMDEDDDFKTLRKLALEFSEASYHRYRQSGDTKLSIRYKWLTDFLLRGSEPGTD